MVDFWSIKDNHRSADIAPANRYSLSRVRERLYSGPWVKELSESRLLENLFMVAVGIRSSSMFHPIDENEILQVHQASRRIGCGMIVRKAGKRVHKVFIFGPDKMEMAGSIPDMDESMGEREFIVGQITMANFSGAFLDFPKCCTDSFVRHLMNATDQDKEALNQLNSHPDPDSRAYFVERFVPCNPGCVNAIREGERIEKEMSEKCPELLKDYLFLREEHMEDVRCGRIIDEKRERDRILLGKSK
jgi:hypothetical protein